MTASDESSGTAPLGLSETSKIPRPAASAEGKREAALACNEHQGGQRQSLGLFDDWRNDGQRLARGRQATAQAAFDAGEHGYYVVNRETRIVGAGPFDDPAVAQREAARRNDIPPVTPGLLEVRLIGPSRVSDW